MPALLRRFNPASRKNVDRETDPYLPLKSPSDEGSCSVCHAVRRNKRWYPEWAEPARPSRRAGTVVLERCPACRKIADGFPAGVVLLGGGFLRDHRDEILKLVRNEERRAMGINPLERIISVTERDGRTEITTTDEKLAQRIGRQVRKACGGTVSYKWSEDSKLLRVEWVRD